MGLFDSLGIFSGGYDTTQGMPDFLQGSNLYGLHQSQAVSQNNMAQQQAFLNALGANGMSGAQNDVYGQQQGLANQLQMQAQGQGPNPALAQLAETTGRNIQQQAALMNSARGAQSNPGLMARQSAQQGGAMQQQSTGQAATLRANQQIAAQQQLGQQQQQMANLATAGVGQRSGALGQLNNQSLTYQQMQQNALTAQNQQRSDAQRANAAIANAGMERSAGAIGGGLNSLGGLMGGGLGKNQGGIIQNFDLGGVAGVNVGQLAGTPGISVGTPADVQRQSQQNVQDPQSVLGQYSKNAGQGNGDPGFGGLNSSGGGASALYQGVSGLGNSLTGMTQMKGLKSEMDEGAQKMMSMFAFASKGGKIDGKAEVKGDSLKNDTVPAMLSPGEIVIPRTSANDPDKIAKFLNGLLGTNFKNHD